MYISGWGLEREYNGLKSFLSWKTEVNKVLNAPSEIISLNWKMHGVAVNTPCLYMDLDGRKNYPLLIYSSRRSRFIGTQNKHDFWIPMRAFWHYHFDIHLGSACDIFWIQPLNGTFNNASNKNIRPPKNSIFMQELKIAIWQFFRKSCDGPALSVPAFKKPT